MLRLKLLLCYGFGLLNLGAHGSASAESTTSDDFWYVGVGVGYSDFNPDTSLSRFSVDKENDIGYTLKFGYRWNEHWALEAFKDELGEVNFNPSGSIEYDVIGLGGVYHVIPNNGDNRFGFYLKGGAASLNTRGENILFEQNKDNQFFIGGGLVYGFNDEYELRSEIIQYDDDALMFSLNVVMNFGKHPQKSLQSNNSVINNRFESNKVETPKNETTFANTQHEEKVIDQKALKKNDIKPAIQKVEIDLKNRIRNLKITFEEGGSLMTLDSKSEVEKLGKMMLENPHISVLLAGHTDDIGDYEFNLFLSEKRAMVVKSALIRDFNIAKSRISIVGYGEHAPVSNNVTIFGRAQNRRVEVLLKKVN